MVSLNQGGTGMCQANLIGHWLDGAPTAEERQRRKEALEAIVTVGEDGVVSYDGPAILDLIRRWDKPFKWVPGRDRGILVHDGQGRLIEESSTVRGLWTK